MFGKKYPVLDNAIAICFERIVKSDSRIMSLIVQHFLFNKKNFPFDLLSSWTKSYNLSPEAGYKIYCEAVAYATGVATADASSISREVFSWQTSQQSTRTNPTGETTITP